MDINLAEDITSISDLKIHINEMADKVGETKRAIVVTRKGKPAFAIVDIAEYEKLRQAGYSLPTSIVQLGRLAEPALVRIRTISKDQAVKTEAAALLSQLPSQGE